MYRTRGSRWWGYSRGLFHFPRRSFQKCPIFARRFDSNETKLFCSIEAEALPRHASSQHKSMPAVVRHRSAAAVSADGFAAGRSGPHRLTYA